MPTPTSHVEVHTPQTDPFAGPPPPARRDGRLVTPGSTHAWTYEVSPEDLGCMFGEVLPILRRATHKPGNSGNGKTLGRGEGARARMAGRGYVEVPHDLEVIAWGHTRHGYMVPHDTPIPGADGKTKRTWTDAWCRPVQVGRTIRYEYDTDGRLDFHRRCLALIAPDGLSAIQIDIATRAFIRGCRNLADRDDTRGKRFLLERLAHLPYEYAPDDLRALMDELGLGPKPSTPAEAPKARRSKGAATE